MLDAVVERLLWSIGGRRVDPTPAGLQDVDEAAEHAAVIDPRLARRLGRSARGNRRKLIVGQPALIQGSFLKSPESHLTRSILAS